MDSLTSDRLCICETHGHTIAEPHLHDGVCPLYRRREQPTKEPISEERLRNTRAWAAARPDMSGSEVIVGAIDELLRLRAALRGIASCSSCGACQSVALTALDEVVFGGTAQQADGERNG